MHRDDDGRAGEGFAEADTLPVVIYAQAVGFDLRLGDYLPGKAVAWIGVGEAETADDGAVERILPDAEAAVAENGSFGLIEDLYGHRRLRQRARRGRRDL